MTHLSDSHLEDPRWDRELRSEEAARELRDAAVNKRKKEILGSASEIEYMLFEYSHTVAKLLQPLLGEDYEDAVPEFRKGISALAEEMADDYTMSLDAFTQEI